MKKILFILLTFITSTSFAQRAVTINCLKFASTSAYEQAITNFATAGFSNIDGFSTYQAMRSTFIEPNVPEGIDPDDDGYDISNDKPTDESKDYKAFGLLGDILNTDKVVIIGNWIVKVDLENDRSLLLNTSFSSQYNDVLSNNLANTNIKVIGLDVNGLDYINELDNPTDDGTFARCTAARAIERGTFFYFSKKKRLDAKVVYQRAAIYFRLLGKGKCQKRFLGIWWADNSGLAVMNNVSVRYTTCKGGGLGYQGDPCASGIGGCIAGYQYGPITTYKPYEGTRGLPYYYLEVNFGGTHGNGTLQIQAP